MGEERREQRGPRPRPGPFQGDASALHHLADALPVHAHVVGDPGERPVLRVGEAEDLGLGGGREHGTPPGVSGPRCTIPTTGLAIESRISVARPLIGPPPLCWQAVRARSSLARQPGVCAANCWIPWGEGTRSSLARFGTVLWRANSLRGLPLRHYRVSHLGAETPQDNLQVVRGDRGRSGAGPRRLDVVLVVRPGPAVLGVPLPLAAWGGTGPLPRAQPRVRLEQELTEGTALPTTSPRGPGHEGTSRLESATIPPSEGRGWSRAARLTEQNGGWPMHGGNETTGTHSP